MNFNTRVTGELTELQAGELAGLYHIQVSMT